MAREQIRAQARAKLADLIGPDEAGEVMPPVAWEQIATKADLAELRGELLEKIGALDGKIGALDARLSRQIGALDGKIGALDGKIGALDGKVSAQTWKMFASSFVSSFSTAGLVFAVLQYS